MVANLTTSAYEALAEQNLIIPLTGGGTLGFSLGTGSTQILAVQPQTQRIMFHNPAVNGETIFVCQATDANGMALTAGPNPGNFAILPGATMTFTGNGVAGAWLAAAAGGSNNPLTVAISQTL
jgi:hypothetical protein